MFLRPGSEADEHSVILFLQLNNKRNETNETNILDIRFSSAAPVPLLL